MSLHCDRLYASAIVTVADVRCRPQDACRGAAETSAGNDIVFPRSGCFVRHVGRRETVADANAVLFFRKHEEYRVSHPVSGGDDCTCLSFAPDVLADAFGAFDPSVADHPDDPFPTVSTLTATEAFTSLQQFRRDLRHARRRAHGSTSIFVDEAAMRLLETAARSAASSGRTTNENARAGTIRAHRELVERARIVLSESMSDPLTLPQIARSVHTSPFHLARVFRGMIGLSLHQYLIRLRLRAALERLADGESDLTTLALSLGFSSHSHFSDAFRRAFKATPSAFRSRLRSRNIREMGTNLKVSPSRIGYV